MQAKSFIDILANELRKEIRAEFEAELASSAPRASREARVAGSAKAEQVELWLNLKIGGALSGSQSLGQSVNPYAKSGNRHRQQPRVVRQLSATSVSQEAVAERVGSAVTIEQTFALEFFKREGSSLASKFTETELKSEFRKIALRIHPDRHVGVSVEQLRALSLRFQTLVESAEILEATLL